MIIDLHCHSVHSRDNHLEPEDLIQRAHELGLDGVCFTEHYSFDSSGPVERLPAPDGFLVLRGVEVSTDGGHLLVYGVRDDSWNSWDRETSLRLERVVDRVHTLGGICIPAHPFRGWNSLGDGVFSMGPFDALETHNGVNAPTQNLRAVQAAGKLGLPSTGGSDCHSLEQVGRAYTEFTCNVKDMDDVIAEIKAGNCRGRFRVY